MKHDVVLAGVGGQGVLSVAAILAEAARRLGTPEARLWTRAWGVDVEALAPARSWTDRRGGAGDPLRILWTRVLSPLYDPGTFLRGLGLLAGRGVAFTATLAGDGPLRSRLLTLARSLGISEQVRFEGWVGETRLRELLAAHAVYVSTSRSDSTSQSLLEAMASGLLPVVSDIPGNREWVIHRGSGLLVPTGDAEALAAALLEAAEGSGAEEMAGAARATASRRARFADTVDGLLRRLEALASGRRERVEDEPPAAVR